MDISGKKKKKIFTRYSKKGLLFITFVGSDPVVGSGWTSQTPAKNVAS